MRSTSWLVFLTVLACSEPYGARSASTGPSARPDPVAPAAAPTATPAAPKDARPPAESTTPSDPTLATAGELQYLEVVLGGAKPDDRLPMIVAVHGLGDNPANFAHLFDTFSEPVRVILPRGIDPHLDGWSWFPIRARDPDVERLATGIAGAADKLAASIDAVAAARKTAGKPILTGFSQGGMLSFAVATRHPDSISLALPVGGWLPPPLWPSDKPGKGAPAIVAFHGTDDAALKYGPTKEAVAALTKQGFRAELITYDGVGHVITPEIQRDLFDRLADATRVAAAAK